MQLRDYQIDAVNSVFDYFGSEEGNPLIVMPTGTGKSLVIAGLLRSIFQYPGQRVVVATHVKELIAQNLEKLLKVWPTAPAGIFSAGLKRKEIRAITFAGIASVAGKYEDFGHVDIVIIDEAHLLNPKDGTRYQIFLSGLKLRNPALKVIGLTATHYRMGQGLLTEPGGIFTDVCMDQATRDAFMWFVDEGYLSMLVPRRTDLVLDLDGIHSQNGDYSSSELQERLDRDGITKQAIAETIRCGRERDRWLVFASGIEHAEHVCNELNSNGIQSTFVHSKLGDDMRDQRLRDYKAGKYRAIVNNGILTTGFDCPEIDLIAMLRPTKSTSLWVQMLGRGTRPVYAPGFDLSTREGRRNAIEAGPKPNCLVLDFARNTTRLGPVNDPVLPRKKGSGRPGEAPVKVCESCGTYNHASVRFCISCGGEFPRAVGLEAKAEDKDLVVRTEAIPEVQFSVDHVTYVNHYSKKSSSFSLKATYYCGVRQFTSYFCFEHIGFPRKLAREWWRNNTGSKPPETVEEARSRLAELRVPKSIRVLMREMPEITTYEY